MFKAKITKNSKIGMNDADLMNADVQRYVK